MARPWALSGLAGTASVQFIEARAIAASWLKLNAFPAASAAFAPATPGRPARLTGGMAAFAALAAAAVAVGVAAAAAGAAAAAEALPDGLAEAPRADWAMFVVLPPEIARMIPSVRPNAIGMARGTAIRAARLLLLRRRHADRCPLSIQSTSMDVRYAAPDASP